MNEIKLLFKKKNKIIETIRIFKRALINIGIISIIKYFFTNQNYNKVFTADWKKRGI